jgi:hypothetical protein
MPPTGDAIHFTLRRALLVLVAVGLVGTLGELLLIPHLEDNWQLAPLIVSGVALVGIGGHLLKPGPASARALFGALALLAAAGFAGLWLHYDANAEFEREISPGSGGLELFWRAVHGAAPPSLAPGALIEFALLGGLALWRDPAFNASPPGGSP